MELDIAEFRKMEAELHEFELQTLVWNSIMMKREMLANFV